MVEYDRATPPRPVEDRHLGAILPPSSLPCMMPDASTEQGELARRGGDKPLNEEAVAQEQAAGSPGSEGVTNRKLLSTSDKLVLSEDECVRHVIDCEPAPRMRDFRRPSQVLQKRLSTLSEMRLHTNEDLLYKATGLFQVGASPCEISAPSCTAICWTTVTVPLYMTMGLAPPGWATHCSWCVSFVAILFTFAYMAVCVYKAFAIAGIEQWAYFVLFMEVSSFLLVLCVVSRSANFRKFMLERIPEVQETINPEMRSSVKWDVLPGFISLAVWSLCHILRVKLAPNEQESALLMVPCTPGLFRAAWAFGLLRVNRFLIGLLERFGQLYPFQLEDLDLAYERWACVVAFARQASHWHSMIYLHMSMYWFLSLFPLVAAVFLDSHESFGMEWLLPHTLANLTSFCLIAYVFQRAAAVHQKWDDIVACVNSFQGIVPQHARRDQDLFLNHRVRSDIGIYACGTCLKASLLAKLASLLVTAGSFLLARLFSMPIDQKMQLSEKWDQMLSNFSI